MYNSPEKTMRFAAGSKHAPVHRIDPITPVGGGSLQSAFKTAKAAENAGAKASKPVTVYRDEDDGENDDDTPIPVFKDENARAKTPNPIPVYRDENARAKTPNPISVYRDENANARTPAPAVFRDENAKTPVAPRDENAGVIRRAKENASTPGPSKVRFLFSGGKRY